MTAAPDHLERDLAANSLGKVVRGETDVQDLRNTLARLKADGKGWQTRANAALRRALGL